MIAVDFFAQEKVKIHAEVRVIVFGDRLYSFKMIPQIESEDIKHLELDQIHHEPYVLDEYVAHQLCELVSSYGLRFAACDFLLTPDGQLVFLELNPNGQWLWLQHMTGFNLVDPFIDFLVE